VLLQLVKEAMDAFVVAKKLSPVANDNLAKTDGDSGGCSRMVALTAIYTKPSGRG
jgi:hypothetical protein